MHDLMEGKDNKKWDFLLEMRGSRCYAEDLKVHSFCILWVGSPVSCWSPANALCSFLLQFFFCVDKENHCVESINNRRKIWVQLLGQKKRYWLMSRDNEWIGHSIHPMCNGIVQIIKFWKENSFTTD
jgi:hypothetical protein